MKLWHTGILLGLTVTVLIFGFGCSPPTPPPEPLEVQVEIKPQWDNSEGETVDPDSITHEFHLLWDQSIPMGGYVHRTDPDSQAALKSINDLLKSIRLTTAYGGGESSLKCLGITDSIMSVDCNHAMSRDFFGGNNSRLDQGIEYAIEGIRSGAFKGAALVSDLIATTDYVTGAVALLPNLNNSVTTAYYNSGKIDVALVGIRIDYWGVHAGVCKMISGPLGCEFDDFRDRYRPLDDVIKRPIYILVMGRRPEGKTQEETPVDKMVSAFVETARSQGMEVKNEILTQGPLGNRAVFQWYPSAPTGYQSVNLSEEGYSCKDNEIYSLKGRFGDSLLSIIEIEVQGFESIFTVSTDRDNAHQLNLEINCKTLRKKFRELCNTKPNKFVGRVKHKGERIWAEWSSNLHSSDKTPGLEQFVSGIRPSHYEVIIEPAPPLSACNRDS